jgi:hypothetical protein
VFLYLIRALFCLACVFLLLLANITSERHILSLDKVMPSNRFQSCLTGLDNILSFFETLLISGL